jgi:hypothetical protein
MAEIPVIRVQTPFDGKIKLYKWANVTENDTCEAFIGPEKSDKTIQFEANNWGGGTIEIRGALFTDLTPELLRDPASDDMIFNVGSRQVATVLQNVYALVPTPTSGTSMDVDVYVMAYGDN